MEDATRRIGGREVPSVHFDYAFVSKAEDEKSLVILITKDRDSRIVMADVVSRKGLVVEEPAQQATDNVLRLGHRGRVIVRCDNEPALLALREAVMQKLKRTSIPEAPLRMSRPAVGLLKGLWD